MSKIRKPEEIAESLKTKILNVYNVCDEGLIKGLIAQSFVELTEYYAEKMVNELMDTNNTLKRRGV